MACRVRMRLRKSLLTVYFRQLRKSTRSERWTMECMFPWTTIDEWDLEKKHEKGSTGKSHA